jgi:hypothetical protein
MQQGAGALTPYDFTIYYSTAAWKIDDTKISAVDVGSSSFTLVAASGYSFSTENFAIKVLAKYPSPTAPN